MKQLAQCTKPLLLVLCTASLLATSCQSNKPFMQSQSQTVWVVPTNSVSYGDYGTSNNPVGSSDAYAETDAHDHNYDHNHSHEDYDSRGLPNYNDWLASHSHYKREINEYNKYLTNQLGRSNVPPMGQLLRSARNWEKCGAEPYQVPPKYLWSNIVPTLRLYRDLKNQGVVPRQAVIRSVYREDNLNRCAGGAPSSKHLENAAIDIWVPNYEDSSWQQQDLKDNLCRFWEYQGASYHFGLGIYATGSIHLDTKKYRKWGAQFTPSYSACRD